MSNALAEQVPPEVVAALNPGQVFLLDRWSKLGLTPDAVGQFLKNKLEIASPEAAAPLIKLYLEATVGMAPQKSSNVHLHQHQKADKFFDEDRLKRVPPIVTDEETEPHGRSKRTNAARKSAVKQ